MTDAELFLALKPHVQHVLGLSFRQVAVWRNSNQQERWSALFSASVTYLADELGEDRNVLWDRLIRYIEALDDKACTPEATEVLDLLTKAWARSEIVLPTDGRHR